MLFNSRKIIFLILEELCLFKILLAYLFTVIRTPSAHPFSAMPDNARLSLLSSSHSLLWFMRCEQMLNIHHFSWYRTLDGISAAFDFLCINLRVEFPWNQNPLYQCAVIKQGTGFYNERPWISATHMH